MIKSILLANTNIALKVSEEETVAVLEKVLQISDPELLNAIAEHISKQDKIIAAYEVTLKEKCEAFNEAQNEIVRLSNNSSADKNTNGFMYLIDSLNELSMYISTEVKFGNESSDFKAGYAKVNEKLLKILEKTLEKVK